MIYIKNPKPEPTSNASKRYSDSSMYLLLKGQNQSTLLNYPGLLGIIHKKADNKPKQFPPECNLSIDLDFGQSARLERRVRHVEG